MQFRKEACGCVFQVVLDQPCEKHSLKDRKSMIDYFNGIFNKP